MAQKLLNKLKVNINQSSQKDYYQILELQIQLTWMSGNYNKEYVIDLFNKLPETPSFFTDRSRLLGMLSDIGEHHESIKRTHQLLNDMKKEKLWRDRSFSPTKIACSVLLSIDHAALGNTETALKYIKSNIKKMNKMPDGPQKIHTLTFTAKALQRLEQYEEAKPLIEKAYLMNLDFKIGIINPHILSQYAHNLAFFNNTIKAIEIFSECIAFNEKNDFMGSLPHHKTLMANAFSSIGMNSKALEILQNAKKIASKQKNDNFLAFIYYEIFKIGCNLSNEHIDLLDKYPYNYLEDALNISLRLELKPLINKCKKHYKSLH